MSIVSGALQPVRPLQEFASQLKVKAYLLESGDNVGKNTAMG